MSKVRCVAVQVFAAAFVWRADSPNFRARGLFSPAGVCSVYFSCNDFNIILSILPEYPFGIDGQAVGSCFYGWDRDITRGRINVGPVLVGGSVEDVVLKIDAVLGEYCNGFDSVGREVDVAFPGCAARRGNV